MVLVFYTSMALKAVRGRVWAGRFVERWFERKDISQRIGWLGGISFGVGWLGCFLPAYRVGAFGNYWVRVQPAMVFILFASLATLGVLFVARNKLTVQDLNLAPLRLSLPLFMVCLLILGAMFYSGFGVVSTEDFWYGAGVPILGSQLIAAIIGGGLFRYFESQWQSKRVDIWICILIYGLTAYFWVHEPLRRSFFLTGPDPRQLFFPFSDAAIFDTASQFPLIGENFFLFKSVFFERPLYLSFLTYLHLLFGQDYELLMAVQAGVFAILPVLIYLIGRSLDVRAVGFGSAVAALLRGVNSISASSMIDTAGPKMMLTDFPTAIGIALTILFICEWLKEPEQNRHYTIWLGSAIGATLMLRTNALLLLAFVPFYVFFKLSNQRKLWWVGSCLILLGAVAITLPWEIRNLSLGGQLYGPIATKFQNIIKQRYLPTPQPGGSLPQDQKLASMLKQENSHPVSIQYATRSTGQAERPCNGVVCFASNHFLHNLITSILILPTSPVMDDLEHLIKERNPYYWKAGWDGKLQGTAPLFLVLHLFLITSGIALAWRQKRLAGLAPLAILIAYNISNGLARTSGGRYIVPIDWIVPLYYLLGVAYVSAWAGRIVRRPWDIFVTTSGPDVAGLKTTGNLSKTLLVFIIVLGLGGIIPLAENLSPPRYQNVDPLETLAKSQALIQASGMDLRDLDGFLQSPNSSILVGRALYPRFYKMNQGEFSDYLALTAGFPRTTFTLIGPAGDQTVVLPGNVSRDISHTSDVLVLGCEGPVYLDALMVIVLGDHATSYARQPASKLECPLPMPVCNNNSVCQ
ncbi:MAG TPA: hypothetical protein VN653_16280 [Anaerolineales bacterium]|nr:hypothetical protein [Anaerolineales bacterium]